MDDIIYINERYRVKDGWIVDVADHCSFSYKHIRNRFTPDERKMLDAIGGLKEFGRRDSHGNVISDDDSEMRDPPMDDYDLIEAGKRYFNVKDFNYNSQGQANFTSMVLSSKYRKVAGLQASSGFGKSLTYILPMMVLQKCANIHYVNFVCVPYNFMIVPTMKKLEKGGLHVEDMDLFLRDYGEYTSPDVFVGCPESFDNDKTSSIFKNWGFIRGQGAKMGYLVFEQAHTLFTDSRSRAVMDNISGLSWKRWRKTLFLSATMDESLYQIILEDRKIPEDIKDNGIFINTIDKVPESNVEIDVETLEYDKIVTEVSRLVRNFINNTKYVNGAFLFGSTEMMRQVYKNVYKKVNMYDSVLMIDEDGNKVFKNKAVRYLASDQSSIRLLLGTKQIANIMDCKHSEFICLVDCSINCVEYFQTAGSSRDYGYVKVLNVKGNKPMPKDTQMKRMFPPIDWKLSISENLARFYNIPFEDHKDHKHSPGVARVYHKILNLKMNVNKDNPQGITRISDEEVLLDEEDEEIDGFSNKLANNVRTLLLKHESGELMKNWKHILGEENYTDTRELLLDIDPRLVVNWNNDGGFSSSICEVCLMRVFGSSPCQCTPTDKVIGGLIYEFFAIQKIVRSEKTFFKMRNELLKRDAYQFLLYLLEELKESVRADFIKLNETVGTNPQYAEDMKTCLINPVEMFQKYFGLICSRRINVVVLLSESKIVHSPSWYSNMSAFYSAMLSDPVNAKELYFYNRYETFAPYKRHILADMEAWYLWNIEEGLIVDDFLGDLNNAPVLVTMLWTIFERHGYDAKQYIVLDHFGNANTFPVFFRYMCSSVLYREKKIPLYVIYIGIKLGNICPDLRELD